MGRDLDDELPATRDQGRVQVVAIRVHLGTGQCVLRRKLEVEIYLPQLELSQIDEGVADFNALDAHCRRPPTPRPARPIGRLCDQRLADDHASQTDFADDLRAAEERSPARLDDDFPDFQKRFLANGNADDSQMGKREKIQAQGFDLDRRFQLLGGDELHFWNEKPQGKQQGKGKQRSEDNAGAQKDSVAGELHQV